jgi:surface antigen
MPAISRRSGFGLAIGGLVALSGCTQMEKRPPAAAAPAAPPPAAPPPAAVAPPAAPQTAAAPVARPRARGAALRRAFTPSDWAMYRDCVNKTMSAPGTGREWRWHNPQSGNGGFMATTSPQVAIRGQACRNFEETITLSDGRRESLNGRAGKRADGSWEIVA